MSEHYFQDDWTEHEESGQLVSGDYWISNSYNGVYELSVRDECAPNGFRDLGMYASEKEAKDAATQYVEAYL